MTEELKINNTKSIACHGFVEFLQEVILAAQDGWILDTRSKYAPQFMVGIFCANFYKLEDEVVEETPATQVEKPENKTVKVGRPTKANKAKAALAAKLPAESLQTITE